MENNVSKKEYEEVGGKRKYRKPKNKLPREERRGSKGEERHALLHRYQSAEDAEELWDEDEEFNGGARYVEEVDFDDD